MNFSPRDLFIETEEGDSITKLAHEAIIALQIAENKPYTLSKTSTLLRIEIVRAFVVFC